MWSASFQVFTINVRYTQIICRFSLIMETFLFLEREMHLEKLSGWDNNDRVMTDEEVRMKRDQVQDLEDLLQQ